MDEYNKKTRDDIHSAIGLAAAGFIVYEAATLMGANPGATAGGGGGGGGGGLTYNLYVAGAFVANYPSIAAADAYENAIPPPTVQETWQLYDSNGTLVQSGTIYPNPLVISAYYVLYGNNNDQQSPQYPPTQAGLSQATAFVNSLIGGPFTGQPYHLFEVTNQGLVQLSGGIIG